MSTEFTAEFFRGNRQRLRKLFTGTAPIVITANGAMQRNSDIAYPFRQDSSFWYLTGINEPNIVLVLDKGKEYLIVPAVDRIHGIFEGVVNNDDLVKRSGIDDIEDASQGWKRLGTRLKNAKYVATLPALPSYMERVEFYTNPARASLITQIKKNNPRIELLDLREHFASMRVIKQKAEISAIKSSVNVTVDTLAKLERNLSKLKSENEIDAYITHEFRKQNARHGYDPIVAGGIHACTLHYGTNNTTIDEDAMVLIDVGAEVEFYSADITRTYSMSGRMTPRQAKVYNAVKDALDFGISQLKPGVSFHDCEQKVRDFVGEKLRELGLIKTITKEAVLEYYPHSPHYLGLDVHDVGDYNQPLAANMVLTLEPGIYIPEEGIGVRIEDDILITRDGCINLSAKLPR